MAYLEVVVASVVFGLTLAGLGATIVAQEKLMRMLERRTYVVALVRSDRQLLLTPNDQGNWYMPHLEEPPDALAIEASAFEMDGTGLEVLRPKLLTIFEGADRSWPALESSVLPPRIVGDRIEGSRTLPEVPRVVEVVPDGLTSAVVRVGP